MQSHDRIDTLGWVLLAVIAFFFLYGVNAWFLMLVGQGVIDLVIAVIIVGLVVALPLWGVYSLLEKKVSRRGRQDFEAILVLVGLLGFFYLFLGHLWMARLERPLREAFVKEAQVSGDVYKVVEDRDAFALSCGYLPVAHWWASYYGDKASVSLIDTYIRIWPLKFQPESERISALKERYALK